MIVLKRKKKEVRLNLSPLIDVVFLLLIFFMITANFSKRSVIEVNLPDARNVNVKSSKKESDIITINSNNNIFLNGKAIDLKYLKEYVFYSKNDIVLRFDKNAEMDIFVKIIDIFKGLDREFILEVNENKD